MSSKMKRLARLFGLFGSHHELPHRVDGDGSGANLGIPDQGKLIRARYQFNPSGNGYQFGAVVAKVGNSERGRVASQIMSSRATPGITERFMGRKIVAMGERDGLNSVSDAEIIDGFRGDVARIVRTHRRIRKLRR